MQKIPCLTPLRQTPSKPPIAEVVGRYLHLRRQGREHIGLCPFHTEKTPSFRVNEDKGVFHCFGCGEGGDVITFIERIEGLDFRTTLAHLGLTDQPRPNRSEIMKKKKVKREAEILATWALNTSDHIGEKMRRVGQRTVMAKTVLLNLESADRKFFQEELNRCERDWTVMETLQEDLIDPACILDLWQEREAILNILGDAGNESMEGMQDPPLLTQKYWEWLQALVRQEA